MKIKHLLTTAIVSSSVLLTACGSSSDNEDNSVTPILDQKGVQSVENLLAQTNQLRNTLDTLLDQPRKVPFLARLNVGEEAIIVSQGVLSATAKCIDDSNDESSETAPTLNVSYLSTAEGSLMSEEHNYLEANVEYTFIDENDYFATLDIDQSSIVAPTGDHISINGETMLLSINAQGTDCMVAGIALTMKGDPAVEFTIPEPTDEDEFPIGPR